MVKKPELHSWLRLPVLMMMLLIRTSLALWCESTPAHRSGSLHQVRRHEAISPAPLRQSAHPGPEAVGRRLCVLPFRWSLPLSVAWNYLAYLSAPAAKTLIIVGVGEENQPAESSILPRRREFPSFLDSWDEDLRKGSDSYIWRNRGVIKPGLCRKNCG